MQDSNDSEKRRKRQRIDLTGLASEDEGYDTATPSNPNPTKSRKSPSFSLPAHSTFSPSLPTLDASSSTSLRKKSSRKKLPSDSATAAGSPQSDRQTAQQPSQGKGKGRATDPPGVEPRPSPIASHEDPARAEQRTKDKGKGRAITTQHYAGIDRSDDRVALGKRARDESEDQEQNSETDDQLPPMRTQYDNSLRDMSLDEEEEDLDANSHDSDANPEDFEPQMAEEDTPTTIYRSETFLVRSKKNKKQKKSPESVAFVETKLKRKQSLASRPAGPLLPLNIPRPTQFYQNLPSNPQARASVLKLLKILLRLAARMVKDPVWVKKTDSGNSLFANDPVLREFIKDYMVDANSTERNDFLLEKVCDYCLTPTGWKALLHCARTGTPPDREFWLAAIALIAIDNPLGVYADVIDPSTPHLPDSTSPTDAPGKTPRAIAPLPVAKMTDILPVYIGKGAGQIPTSVPWKTLVEGSNFNEELRHDLAIRYPPPPGRQQSSLPPASAAAVPFSSPTPTATDYPNDTLGMTTRTASGGHSNWRYRESHPSLHYRTGYPDDFVLEAPTTNVQSTIYPLVIIPPDFESRFGYTPQFVAGYAESLLMLGCAPVPCRVAEAYAQEIDHELVRVEKEKLMNVIPGTASRPIYAEETLYAHDIIRTFEAPDYRGLKAAALTILQATQTDSPAASVDSNRIEKRVQELIEVIDTEDFIKLYTREQDLVGSSDPTKFFQAYTKSTPLRFVDQSGSLARFWLRWNGVEVPLPFAWIAAENVQDVLTFDQHGLVTVHFASDAFSSQYPTPVFRQFSSSPDHLPFGILFRSRQDPNLATWLTFDCQGESMHPGYDLRIPMPETDAQFERRSTAWRLFYEKVAGKLEVERSAIEEALAVIPALTERFFGDR